MGVTPKPSADYLRGFSSGVEAAEGFVADVLDEVEAEAELHASGPAPVGDIVGTLRLAFGLRHPYGAHHSAPGLASRLPE